jgi:acyl-CoA synthetase (AMP-forming)/AMP-acid ligase II
MDADRADLGLESFLDSIGIIEVTTLGDLILRAAKRHGARDALVMPGVRLSYNDVAERALMRARGLMALGVKGGDHVALLLPTSVEFLEFMFGVALAGAVPVPINARYRGHELRYLAENSDAVVVVTTGMISEGLDLYARLAEGLGQPKRHATEDRLDMPGLPRLRHIVHLGNAPAGTMNADEFRLRALSVPLAEAGDRRARVRLRDMGLLLYTSGTTSNPKGCMLSHEAMVRNGMELARRYRMNETDSFWSPLPMFHIAGIMPIIATTSTGGRYVTAPVFDAGVSLRQLADEQVTINFACFAPIMADLINHPTFKDIDFSKVRMMNSSLALQPGPFREMLTKAMPGTIHVSTYGLSESSGTVTTSRLDDPEDARLNRLGGAMPGMEIRIVDNDGHDLPPGGRGQILLRGYGTCAGYYKDGEKTAATIRGGWLHTGDIGSLDERGHLMFHGRLKEMLKVGGENVAALEVESFIGGHPAVKLCQVVGIPHERLVEVPAAFIELRPGTTATEQEIIAFCKDKISSFKVPRYVRVVQEWPMGTSKIQKFRLRDSLLAELGLPTKS